MKFIKQLTLCALTFIGVYMNAQSPDLEITQGSRAAANGPVLDSGPFTFFQNTDNPTGTTYSAYSTTPLTVTFTITNPQVTSGSGISTVTNSPVNFGFLGNGFNNAIIQRPSVAGSPADNNFTSSGAPTGTGIAAAGTYTAAQTNYGVSINQSVNYLTGQPTSGTYYQADLTMTFNRPVNNPILHFGGLGGVAGGGGFSGEYELKSSNTPVTFSLLSTATSLGLINGGNTIANTSSLMNTAGPNSGSGSVLVTGTGITTITFKVYVRGNGNATTWGTSTSADGYTLGISLLESDLAVTKTVNKFVAVPGTNVTFTITATNNGPSHSANTKVTDLLPSGYTFVSATPSTGSYNSSTGEWAIGTLNAGASATMTLVATVKSTVTGNYDNGASITGDNSDPDLSNNIASAVVSPDSDGDGLPDWQDLDDDNDGILDTDECTSTGQNFLVDSVLRDGTLSNGTVAAGSWPTENVTNPATAISYSGANGEVSHPNTVINFVDSSNPNSLVQNYNVANIAQTANSTSLVSSTFVQFEEFDSGTPSITYTNVYDHLGNQLMTLSDIQFFNIGAWNSAFTSFTLNSSYITITNPTPGTFVVTKTASSPQYVAFRFKSRTAGFISRFNSAFSNLAANDWVTHKFGRTLVCDADGDGIPNTLDLDSDNDGCVDAVEGDENVLPSQLVSAGGLLSVGTGSTASNQNLCAGTTCVNANGVPNIVNSGGTADIGGDQGQGIGSSQSLGSATTITQQPIDQTVTTSTTNFSVTATGGSGQNIYQWQVSQDNGTSWTNLSNNTTYSGTDTATLTITGATMSMNGYDYRVIITQQDYACTNLTSSSANLTLIDSDGDGIDNVTDLDDDNDGILDTDEGYCESTSVYTFNVSSSVSSNTVARDGGTANLIFTLTSGTPVQGIGNSFTIPLKYSDLNRNITNSNDDEYNGIVTRGTGATMRFEITPDVTLIDNNLPTNNLQAENITPGGSTDQDFQNYINNKSIDVIGNYNVSLGYVPISTGLLSTKQSESIAYQTNYAGVFRTNTVPNQFINYSYSKAYANTAIAPPGVIRILPITIPFGSSYDNYYTTIN